MALLTLHEICLSFGGSPLLDHVDATVEPGERICLIGRNGVGKSSLLRVIAQRQVPDAGRVALAPGRVVATLEQEVPDSDARPVLAVVLEGLGTLGAQLSAWRDLHATGQDDHRRALLETELAHHDGWGALARVEALLDRMALPTQTPFDTLSGGLKRRVLLARALAPQPDLLLLDEPTNHLDIATINALEETLLAFGGALLFITHDRSFLRRLATRIWELDRGHLGNWPGDYDRFLERRAQLELAEAKQEERFDRRLAQEEVWIRKGIEARRTRNEGRVRALLSMREERRQRRSAPGQAQFEIQKAAESGRLVVEAEDVHYAWEGQTIIRGLSTLILRGDRIGIIGPNGCGKTTLLNLLLGRLSPQSGRVRLGSRMEVAYFDQMRSQLDPNLSVADNVANGRTQVQVDGRSRHILGYLEEFLFTPDRARSPARILSGGERNRLLLARLFLAPSNLLVLDEPTNDLDVETLELLEERLTGYPGTILLVSHDRAFLDNVVSATLVFEGPGQVTDYAGGYSDWLVQRPPAPLPVASRTAAPAIAAPSRPACAPQGERPRRLGYMEKRELEALPGRIEELEAALSTLRTRLCDPALYQSPGGGADIPVLQRQEQTLEIQLSELYHRWEELESRAQG
ncbi:MAG: ATP-binding cassette domain-containing protein [Magnetococcus sp. WYHC-3]